MFLFVHVLTLNNPGQIFAPITTFGVHFRHLICIDLFDSFFLLEASSPYGTAVRGVLTAHSQSSISDLIIFLCHVTSDNRTSMTRQPFKCAIHTIERACLLLACQVFRAFFFSIIRIRITDSQYQFMAIVHSSANYQYC